MTNYDEKFYGSHVDSSIASAQRVVPEVAALVRPKSVLDVGSGTGAWLKAWLDEGVEVLGLDGDYVPRESRLICDADFRSVDVSVPFDLGRTFDLVMSLETAEHLDPERAEGFVASLVRHGEVVMFSAAIPGQGGTDHVNEQWPQYWANKFAHHGYGVFDVIRSVIWDDPDVAVWYKQNLLLFATEQRANQLGLTPRNEPLNLVHPEQFSFVVGQTLATQIRHKLAVSSGGAKLQKVRSRLRDKLVGRR